MVSFRQCCEVEKSGLFLFGQSREDRAHRNATDVEAAGDFVLAEAGATASGTITRRLTSITKAHQAAGYADSPASTHHMVVGETLKGIRRTIGTAQKGKDPLLTADIRKIVSACPNSLIGLRDRALTLVGFSGGFRRSELARIQRHDLTFGKNGVIIEVPMSEN